MTSQIRNALFSLAILSVTACTGQGTPAGKQSEPENQRIYSAEDKRIAQLLSIGETAAQDSSSPRDQALLCSIALQSIANRLRQSGALSEAQLQAFAKAQNLYLKRAAIGRSATELATAKSAMETAHPESSERARLAIGCLRNLS